MIHLNIFYAAAGNIVRHKLRSFVVVLCLVAILFPFISAVSVLEGVKAQSRLSVDEGADIYVTTDMFGRNGMIPFGMGDEIEKIDGVVKAAPRVISRIYIKGKLAVLLGIPTDEVPPSVSFIKGSMPREGEIVIGMAMADYLDAGTGDDLSIGVKIFAIIDHVSYMQNKVFRISGIFDSASGIWTSDLIMMDIEEAISLYEMEDMVTDIAVYVKPGYEVSVVENIQKASPFFRIQTKNIARNYVEKGFNIKGGIFAVLYTIAFALAIPVILVLSGLGPSGRRKEIGILKATGWQTIEVMEMVFIENIILALIAASASILISFLWIKLFNAPLIAQIFISGTGSIAPFPVPARFMPLPFMLSFFFAIILTMVGSIYSTWKAAVVPPVEAMR